VAEPFVSIEDSADKLISWIDENAGGRVRVLCGLSLGAQIAAEALSRRPGLTECAILESALVVPMRGAALTALACRLSYGLIRRRWFSRMQAGALGLPENMFERYYQDSLRMSRETLVNIAVGNASYRLKPSIAGSGARVLVVVGGRELGVMRASARKLCAAIPGGTQYVAEGMRHGELSLRHPAEYLGLLEKLLSAR
jgi:pimeloyl-ACP methyl ester carboxylesterase